MTALISCSSIDLGANSESTAKRALALVNDISAALRCAVHSFFRLFDFLQNDGVFLFFRQIGILSLATALRGREQKGKEPLFVQYLYF